MMTIARPPPTLADADGGFLDLCASFATAFAHADASPSVRGGDASADDAMIWQVAPAMRTTPRGSAWENQPSSEKCLGKVRSFLVSFNPNH